MPVQHTREFVDTEALGDAAKIERDIGVPARTAVRDVQLERVIRCSEGSHAGRAAGSVAALRPEAPCADQGADTDVECVAGLARDPERAREHGGEIGRHGDPVADRCVIEPRKIGVVAPVGHPGIHPRDRRFQFGGDAVEVETRLDMELGRPPRPHRRAARAAALQARLRQWLNRRLRHNAPAP